MGQLSEQEAKARDRYNECVWAEADVACDGYGEADTEATEAAWDVLVAAVEARVRAECAAKVRSEQMVDDLSDVVDDVNPRKTHAKDIADARVYCEFIAKRIAEAP